MKKEAKARLIVIKDYLQKWDWDIAPLFMVSEEDAKVLLELLDIYEKTIDKRADKYRKRKEKAHE